MTKGLGKEYVVMNDMSFKPYSCCRWQHAALDCIQQIKQEHNLLADDVKEIIIHSFAWVKSQEAYDLHSVVDGQFCMPYTAYMVLQGYRPGPGWYTEEHLNNEAIADLARKVTIIIDPEMDKVYFETDEVSARVEVITQTGETYTKFVDIPKGDPRNPLSKAQIEEKFKTQASFVLNEEDILRSIEMINNFENLDNISELMTILCGAR
jgi:2-methylcitrate dehydratase PrpD